VRGKEAIGGHRITGIVLWGGEFKKRFECQEKGDYSKKKKRRIKIYTQGAEVTK